ncbi:MAG: pectate lyase [Pirellulaceae bacterium]
MRLTGFITIMFGLGVLWVAPLQAADRAAARQSLQNATSFLRSISTNGGYVGIYSPDLKERYGEALYERASGTQIWVQPPGTPSVGQVFLRAYRVTGEQRYLDAAREVGRALAWGQRKEGGWDHRVDVAHLSPDAKTPERKSGHCTFDDDITQGAITFLMELDQKLDEPWLEDSVQLALEFMMEAQFDNGAWPQWYPLRGGYHDYYTYNDNAINDCIRVMLEAHRLYHEPVYLESARDGGDFIIASQLPAPQAGWAQQYSHDLEPAWARGFEPPGVCSAATARNMRTLIELYLYTGSEKYLRPIPDAIDWLNRSKLAAEDILESEVGQSVDDDDAFWARLYEVQTNKPVYGDRENPREMIYDIREVSEKERSSYGWQGTFGVPGAIRYYRKVKQQGRKEILRQRRQTPSEQRLKQRAASLEPRVDQVISRLDPKGFWLTDGMLRIGTFVRNMNLLCDFLECSRSGSSSDAD